MKKILLIAVMLLSVITASAQIEKGFRMGFQANIGISTCEPEEPAAVGCGYGLGWIAEYNFCPNIFFQSGIGLQNIATNDPGFDKTLNAFYGQLPLHLGFRFNIKDSYTVFLQSGLTLGVGLFGTKMKVDYDEIYKYFDIASRFDLEAGVRVGMEFNNIQVSLGVNHGLLNVFEDYIDGYGNNVSANIGIAYMF